jgi:hypothetical protein
VVSRETLQTPKLCNAAVDDSSGLISETGARFPRVFCLTPATTQISVLGSSSRSRVARMFHSSEKTTLRLKPKVPFWVTVAYASSRLSAGTGQRPRSRKDIANLCGHPCPLCSPLVMPTAVRRFGTWSAPLRVSRIASKSCSVGRGTPSGMTALRRFISSSSFPAQWTEEVLRPARRCRDHHSRRTSLAGFAGRCIGRPTGNTLVTRKAAHGRIATAACRCR